MTIVIQSYLIKEKRRGRDLPNEKTYIQTPHAQTIAGGEIINTPIEVIFI